MARLLKYNAKINYEQLTNYHFSAKAIGEIRKANGQPQITDFEFRTIVLTDNDSVSMEVLEKYLWSLSDLGVLLHEGNMSYIATHIRDLEGSMNNESPFHQKFDTDIELLLKLIKLKNSTGKISIEIRHRPIGESVEFFNLEDRLVTIPIINSSIDALFNSLVSDETVMPFELIDEIRNLPSPDEQSLKELKAKLFIMRDNLFHSLIISTICKSLRNYLNEFSVLSNPTANLTNDQARVIYEVCKFHRLIQIEHELDFEKLNYVRSIFTNSAKQQMITSQLSGS